MPSTPNQTLRCTLLCNDAGFKEQRAARAEEVESQTACRRPRAKLSMMMPAIWRPLPTPAPSPMKKPAPAPPPRRTSC